MVNFCHLSVTRTVYAFVTHFVMAHVHPETNFTTRIEVSVTLKISLQGFTPILHSMTPIHSIKSEVKIHSARKLVDLDSLGEHCVFYGVMDWSLGLARSHGVEY